MSTEFPEIFDPKSQEGNSWNPLPVGEYVAQIVEASVLQPKSRDGFYLRLTWKIAASRSSTSLVPGCRRCSRMAT